MGRHPEDTIASEVMIRSSDCADDNMGFPETGGDDDDDDMGHGGGWGSEAFANGSASLVPAPRQVARISVTYASAAKQVYYPLNQPAAFHQCHHLSLHCRKDWLSEDDCLVQRSVQPRQRETGVWFPMTLK